MPPIEFKLATRILDGNFRIKN